MEKIHNIINLADKYHYLDKTSNRNRILQADGVLREYIKKKKITFGVYDSAMMIATEIAEKRFDCDTIIAAIFYDIPISAIEVAYKDEISSVYRVISILKSYNKLKIELEHIYNDNVSYDLFTDSDLIVDFFENEGNKQVFIDNCLIRKEQACVLNGAGVNLEEYSYTEYPDENEPIRFLFIGRVMKEKGVEELFEAAQLIKKEMPRVVFDIVGPMEDEYRKVIHKLEKENIISYYGYQSDVKPFISRCHCFVLPSWHEGMANTNLESASMGRPIITSNIHGCLEAVENGKSGYLVRSGDTNDLYTYLKKFIKLSYKEKKEMGINGRKYMEQNFDKTKIVNKTIKVLLENKL